MTQRELTNITNTEYLIGYENKLLDFETDEEKMKNRYEKLFVKTSYRTGIPVSKLLVDVIKFITFNIEDKITVKMSLPFTYGFLDGNFYYAGEIIDTLKNANVRSLNFFENNIVYDSITPVLNEIRKAINTRYEDSDLDFVVDFFENFYKKNIVGILKNLANSHFDEAVVRKIGNAYAITYKDLYMLKAENINYDEEDMNEKFYNLSTEIDLDCLVAREQIKEIYFSELEELKNFKILSEINEKKFYENLDNSLEIEEIYEDVVDFKLDMSNIDKEKFTFEEAGEILSNLGALDNFVKKIKNRIEELEDGELLKEVVEHYLSLHIFNVNFFKLYNELERQRLLEELEKEKKEEKKLNIRPYEHISTH